MLTIKEDVTKIEMSLFIEAMLKLMIKNGRTEFNCGFERRTERIKNYASQLYEYIDVYIDSSVFKFVTIRNRGEVEGYNLYSINGSIRKYSEFTKFIDTLNNSKVLFKDDLYDGVFEDIDVDQIVNMCMPSCICGTCENILCGLKHCQACKYSLEEPECDSDNDVDGMESEGLVIHIIDTNTHHDNETLLESLGISILTEEQLKIMKW